MLKFRLGSVPVSVHLSFLLLGLFGWMRFETLAYTAAWTIGVFFAILVHESGHAFTARAFATPNVRIMLFAFGGATTYPLTTRITPGRRFLISAAGSALGIATGAVMLAVGTAQGWFEFDFSTFPPRSLVLPEFLAVTAVGFVEAALLWGVLNWLPMRPLDGGQMVQSAMEIVAPKYAEPVTRVVSLAIGIPVIAWALINEQIFIVMIVGILLLSGLRRAPQPPPRQQAPQQGDQEQATRPEVVDEPPSPRPQPPPQPKPETPPDFPI